jgi:disulfide oxidoreductase YuzD
LARLGVFPWDWPLIRGALWINLQLDSGEEALAKVSTMKHSDVLELKILDYPGDSSPCPCLLPTGGPEYFAFIQQKVASLKVALEKAYPGKARVTYINLQENPADQESAEGQLLVNKKLCAPLVLIDGEPRFSGMILVQKIVKEVGLLLGAH